MQKNVSSPKVIIHYCQICDNKWFSKKEEIECPECHSFFLDIEKK